MKFVKDIFKPFIKSISFFMLCAKIKARLLIHGVAVGRGRGRQPGRPHLRPRGGVPGPGQMTGPRGGGPEGPRLVHRRPRGVAVGEGRQVRRPVSRRVRMGDVAGDQRLASRGVVGQRLGQGQDGEAFAHDGDSPPATVANPGLTPDR